jgi:predicted regulator of Ras-like GTPase activity (Roadblock/LC7/MglB family)
MSFRKPLEDIVKRASGAVGAVFVDDDGETIEQFTNGSSYEIRLAGAHHGIILQLMEKIVENVENIENSRISIFSPWFQ